MSQTTQNLNYALCAQNFQDSSVLAFGTAILVWFCCSAAVPKMCELTEIAYLGSG
jgi:hypothetical protein